METLPESHLDLIDGAYTAILTTVMPDGQPQTTPIWCNREGDHILINTMQGFRKEKNMRANPRVTVLIYDPQQPTRNIEIRGRVTKMQVENALTHLDELTRLYLDNPEAHFFGDCIATEHQAKYVPVRIKIAPSRVRVEG
ncbi:MAG: TIGR03618 family F420-dependent PPOX class oxidoreductase [Chloroflexi bacterium]|nr:TIGR03618 family F420-dependent PPOX class oxidoreductase [Chloroflexota bacterium]